MHKSKTLIKRIVPDQIRKYNTQIYYQMEKHALISALHQFVHTTQLQKYQSSTPLLIFSYNNISIPASFSSAISYINHQTLLRIQQLQQNFQLRDSSHPYIVFEKLWWSQQFSPNIKAFVSSTLLAGDSVDSFKHTKQSTELCGSIDAVIEKFRNNLANSCSSVLDSIGSLSSVTPIDTLMHSDSDQDSQIQEVQPRAQRDHTQEQKTGGLISNIANMPNLHHESMKLNDIDRNPVSKDAEILRLQQQNLRLLFRLAALTETCIGLIDALENFDQNDKSCQRMLKQKCASAKHTELSETTHFVKAMPLSFQMPQKHSTFRPNLRTEETNHSRVQKQSSCRLLKQFNSSEPGESFSRLGSPIGQRVLNKKTEEMQLESSINRKNGNSNSEKDGGSSRKAIIDKIRQIRGLMNGL